MMPSAEPERPAKLPSGSGITEFMVNTIAKTLIHASAQAWVLHVQTSSYAEHIALAELYGTLDAARDKFMERYGSRNESLAGNMAPLKDYGDETPASLVAFLLEFFKDVREESEIPAEFANEVDDLMGSLRQTAYMLTLT